MSEIKLNLCLKIGLLLLVILLPSLLPAQKIIQGTIRNAETGEPLPAANIIIQGVYQGTVSNSNGFYRLAIADSLLPATVEVRYIGFYSIARMINEDSPREQNFSLKPSVAQLEQLTVTAEAEDLTVMERVIRRKQQWRKKLHSYKAQAYSRRVLSNDTSIVSIGESVTAIYWNEQEGTREVLKWRNQTENIDVSQNLAGVRYLHNLYDDNIEIAGYKMVGITHPEATRYYDFKVIDLLSINGQKVYKIKVTPDKNLQPLFKGVAFVLDEAFALLKVNLSPNETVRFPVPIKDFQFNYKQQYSNFGGKIWLPVNIRVEGEVKIEMLGLEFPRMKFSQTANITDYKVNIALPDSLFDDGSVRIDSTTVADSIFAKTVERIPLSAKQQRAYAAIDSTDKVEEAFKPSGFLTRFIDFSGDVESGSKTDTASTAESNTGSGFNLPGQYSPRLRYNRVEGLYAGLKYRIEIVDDLELMIEGGYSTTYKNWSYGGGLRYALYELPFNPVIGALYRLNTAPRYSSLIYNRTVTSVPNIFGFENYFDYFRNEGFKFYLRLRDPDTDLSLNASFASKKQTSLETKTAYDIFGRDYNTRPNPAINEGRLNALSFTFGYNNNESYSYGVTGFRQFTVGIELSGEELGSDFNYTRFTGNISWSFQTFFQRRLFPNTLHLWLQAGTFTGRLPYQKFGIIDVAEGAISPFGVLRTVRFRPYEGAKYVALHAEHNFRTVPFEILNLDWLVEHNIGLIAFGSIAKTYISGQRRAQIISRTGYIPFTTNGIHAEAGLSLTGILTLFRVDFAYRIDDPGLFVGIALTRFL